MSRTIVWLTSYNHEKFLRESIDSILAQTYRDFELYITDDCSTDGSWVIIQSYQDPRIHVFRHDTNWGNSGLSLVIETLDCRYLAIAHSDDKWMPDKLEKQVAYLDTHPDVAACFTQVQVIDGQSRPLADEKTFYGRMFAQKNRSRFEWLRSFFDEGCLLCHPSVLIRRECYEKYSMFASGLASIPDFFQWIRLCKNAEIFVLPEKLTCFRLEDNGKNTSGDNSRAHCRNATELYFVLKEYGTDCDQEGFLKIFPQAKKYLPCPEIPVEYAYAMFLLEKQHSKIYHLYGMQLLYGLLQDPEKAALLEEKIGFTKHIFGEIETRDDIFSIVPAGRLMRCKVYFNFGDGFSDDQIYLKDSLYVNEENFFFFSFSMEQEEIQKISAGRQLQSLRLDPDDGVYRTFWDVKLLADGSELVGIPCSRHHLFESKVEFETVDPQFFYGDLFGKGVKKIYVEGYTQIRDAWQLDAEFAHKEIVAIEQIETLKEERRALEERLNQQEAEAESQNLQKQEEKHFLRIRRLFDFNRR